MSKRVDRWRKFSHLLPPESVWQRIGNPVAIADGFAFIVRTSLQGGPLYMLMRYQESTGKLVQAGDRGRDYTYRDNRDARDALARYAAKEA